LAADFIASDAIVEPEGTAVATLEGRLDTTVTILGCLDIVVQLQGWLGTQDGRPIANLSVATSETWCDRATGERRERTEWHRVVIFNEGLAKVAKQYLRKGSKVYLEGSLQTRKWQDQSGRDKYSTEVVLQAFNSKLTMLDRAGDRAGGDVGSDEDDFGVSPSTRERKPAMAGTSKRGDMDDDVPF